GDDPPAGGVVEILASVFTRVARSNIPEAPVPATMAALADAGRTVDPVEAVTMNAYGCSLVWGILRPRPERARLLSSSPNSSSGAASDCAPAAEKTAGACRTGTGLTAEYQGVPMEINGTANCRRRESGVAGWWRPSLSATQPCSACICPTRSKRRRIWTNA